MSQLSLMGASGFIGTHYARLYPAQTYCEPRESVAPLNRDVLFLRSTTSNYNVLQPETFKLDVQTNLLHLLDVLPNVAGTFNYTSTWFVGGENGRGDTVANAARETDLCNPNGFYSATKLCAEQLIRSYVQTVSRGCVANGPSNYRILRLSNVIGNDPRAGKTKNALEMLLKRVLKDETIHIYDGDNYRDILHVDDTCRAINLAISNFSTLNGTINIGRGESHRMIDLVMYAIRCTGSKSKVQIVTTPDFHKIVQVKDYWMDTSHLAALGFKPRYSIEQSIDLVLTGIENGL